MVPQGNVYREAPCVTRALRQAQGDNVVLSATQNALPCREYSLTFGEPVEERRDWEGCAEECDAGPSGVGVGEAGDGRADGSAREQCRDVERVEAAAFRRLEGGDDLLPENHRRPQ